MGAFDVVPNITLPEPDSKEASKAFRKKHGENATAEQEFRAKWGWEPHEQVIIRGTFTQGDQEAIGNAASSTTKDGKVLLHAGTGRTQMLEQMIVDWTLMRNGRKVEVTAENIRRLPSQYSTPILEKCDEIASGMSENDQSNSSASVNEHSQEDSEKVKTFQRRS